jgi:hypothetical protein
MHNACGTVWQRSVQAPSGRLGALNLFLRGSPQAGVRPNFSNQTNSWCTYGPEIMFQMSAGISGMFATSANGAFDMIN